MSSKESSASVPSPAACPSCGRTEWEFVAAAAGESGEHVPGAVPSWRCAHCAASGTADTSPPPPPDHIVDFLKPVQIDDQGRLWLAADCGDWAAVVREHGLTAVFDLEEDLDRGIPDHPNRVLYVYFPIEDEGLPGLHKLHALARLGAQLMAEGERILVHCEMGLSRSALLAGLMLVYGGMSGPTAVDRLQTRRPGALYNQVFATHLAARPPGGAMG
jgi:hypothetical protein